MTFKLALDYLQVAFTNSSTNIKFILKSHHCFGPAIFGTMRKDNYQTEESYFTSMDHLVEC